MPLALNVRAPQAPPAQGVVSSTVRSSKPKSGFQSAPLRV